MKKWKMLAALLITLCVGGAITVNTEAAKPTIDIYLIAGQSNAAGTTRVYEKEMAALDSRYIDGFENIFYTGSAANPNATPYELDIQNVKVGCGISANYMGPEVGMAESLSKYYNSETGKYAGFIKYAEGATSLLYTGRDWVSPSYKKTLTGELKDTTGYHYNEFIDEVKQRMQEYKNAGYEPVIKGMFWMQGEQNRTNTSEYTKAFKYFVSDIRNDLSKITGQKLQNMPVMVGEISRTFQSGTVTEIELNNKFITAQRNLPQSVSDCYIIPSAEYDMNSKEGIVGSDNAHWNYEDCLTIGNLVGDCIEKLYFSTEHDHKYDKEVAEEKYLRSAGTCTKKAVYYKSCSCGAKSNSETFEGKVSHTYGAWKVTKKATAIAKGTKQRTCKKCGYVQVSKIAKTTANLTHKHIYNQKVEEAKYLKTEGTCTKKAIYYKSCSCGEASDSKTFKGQKAPHTYGSATVLKEATETKAGMKQRTCIVCEHVETTEIPVLEAVVEETPLPEKEESNILWWVLLIISLIFIIAAIVIVVVSILSKKKQESNVAKENENNEKIQENN